jgi:hypothetical protein
MTKYVELKTAIDAVNDVYYDTPDINLSADKLEAALRGIPYADVVPVVHGYFVYDEPRLAGGVDWGHCSNCGSLAFGVETRFDYCPWCGAIMDGGDNDDA